MKNDYLFHVLLQENNDVLKSLISSLMCWKYEDVISAEIQNPIELGKSITSKFFILDVKVLLNSELSVNIEMQIVNHHNWPERSLSYLCRDFDSLKWGEDYLSAKPAYQISFTDFTLFPDHPEFFSSYCMMNSKNHHIYTDKFRLFVVNLRRIDLATYNDKKSGLVSWAEMFNAKRWEELRMLAKENEYIDKAVNTAFKMSQDELIRYQMEAREDYYKNELTNQRLRERLEKENMHNKSVIADMKAALADKEAALADKEAALADKEATLADMRAEIIRLRNMLENQQ